MRTESVTEVPQKLDLFTNRYALIRHFLASLNEDPAFPTLLFYQGDGGNGKSLLLRYFKAHCCKRFEPENWNHVKGLSDADFRNNVEHAEGVEDLPVALLDFGAPPRREDQPQESLSALFMLRRRLNGSGLAFPRFRYASLRYLKLDGKLTREKVRDLYPDEEVDLAVEAVEMLFNVSLPFLGDIPKLLDKHLGTKVELWRAQLQLAEEEGKEIDRLDLEGLAAALPTFFAQDLNVAMGREGSPERVVLLFDTHEAFWPDRAISTQQFFERDEWLRRLLHALQPELGIVVIVAGRDDPRWKDAHEFPVDDDRLEVRRIEGLREPDAYKYLGRALEGLRVPDVLQEALVRYASVEPDQVHPLFLGLCADVVRVAHARGERLSVEDFPEVPDLYKKGDCLIDHLMRYVRPRQADAVYALSACRSFDRNLYMELGKTLDLGPARADFGMLAAFSFVETIEADEERANGQPRYRLHGLLRRLLSERGGEIRELVREAHTFLEDYYRKEAEERDPRAVAEAIHHANRLEWERGAKEWLEQFEQATEISDLGLCEALLEVRGDLDLHRASLNAQGSILAAAATYLHRRTRHAEAKQAYLEAVTTFGRAAESDPRDHDIYNNRGCTLRQLGAFYAEHARHNEAVQAHADAVSSFDQALGLIRSSSGTHTDLERTEAIADMQSNRGVALLYRGKLHAQLSQNRRRDDDRVLQVSQAKKAYDQSLASFASAIELAPDNSRPYNNRGIALFRLGELYVGESQAASNPLDRWQLIKHARSAFSDAIKASEQAIKIDSENGAAYSGRGNALCGLGKLYAQLGFGNEAKRYFHHAVDAFDDYLKLIPNDARVHNSCGLAWHYLGELHVEFNRNGENGGMEKAKEAYDTALAAYERAIELAPYYVGAYNSRGLALHRLGELQEQTNQPEPAEQNLRNAIATFDFALKLAPGYSTIEQNRTRAAQSLETLLGGSDSERQTPNP